MKNKFTQELIISLSFVVVLLIAINPFHFFMPDHLTSLLLAIIVVFVGVLAGITLDDNPRDERDQLHAYLAGRIGYLSGIIALVILIMIQNIRGTSDVWAFIILGIMIIAKLLGTWWSRRIY